MPNRILHKRNAVAGQIPAAASLTPGELALNTADGRVYTERDNGTVVEVGNPDATITFVMDGGTFALNFGEKGELEIPFKCQITGWTLLADTVGSVVVDIWKCPYANYPPGVANTITGSAKPTLTTAVKAQSSTLSGWTTTITAGDILRFVVDTVDTVIRVTLSLKVRKL